MKVLANDSITLTKIIDGIDGTNSISVILSSYAINLPSNSEGAIIDYSNSQVDIIVLEGQKSLTPTLNASLSNGQFRLKNTILKNIGSIAQPTINKDKIKTGVISQFTSNQDSGSAEFEIEYKTSTGDINTVNMTLTFTKAKQGLAGTPGKDGKPVFTSIRYSNEICDRENFIPTTATINPNADTFSIGVYTGEIDYDSPNNHWEQNLDKYKWSAYGQQSIKEIKTTFKATSSMNKPNSVDFKDTNIPSDFNAQNKYLWKKDIYFYNGTNTTTESINLIATYGKDGQSANTLSATSGSYSINKSEVIITGNSAHTDILNSTGTNLFVYNYDGSLAEKINYNTYSDPNLCNTLLAKIQSLRDKIFVLMECDSGSMTQQLRNELILSGGSQTDIWNKQRRAWIFISLSKKSTNNQYPLQKGQAYEVSNIGDNKKENLTVSLTGSGIVANGSTGTGIISIQTKYQATNNASKPTQGWEDSIWSTTIPTLTDGKKYLYSITRYTYSDNRTTDIIDLISVKGSDGENGKILYQDTVPVAPSIGTQWFNTGTNNGYINNTLYVFDGKNWKVMEFSAENIKTNVLNALQANMDNTNISHKLIVGNKTGKRVELDGYNGTLTIYNSNNQKVFYTGADGNLNFQGNLSFSSGSSVSQAIDKKADTSYVNNKVDGISIGGINLLNGTSNFDNKYWIQRSGYPATQLLSISPKISDAPSISQMDKVISVTSGKLYGEIFLEKDQPYTVSVYIKGDSGTIGLPEFAFLNLSNNDHFVFTSGQKETIGTNWKRISKTFNGTGKKYTNFYMRLAGSNLSSTNAVYIAGYQLEKGNKLTSYSPSPEDNVQLDSQNILTTTGNMKTFISSATTANGGWRKAGGTGGNGKFIIENNNPPISGITNSFKIINESTAYNDSVVAQDTQTYEIGQDYVLSCYARKLTDNSHSGNPKLRLQTYGVGGLQGNIEVSNTNWQQFYITGKATQTNGNCYFGNVNPSSIIEICGMKLEKGIKPTAWSPNPLDSSVSINETNKDLNNQLKNRENLWPNQTFEEGLLSDFTTISNNDNSVRIVVNGVKNSINESPKDFGVEYKKQNSSNKSLRLNGRTDGNRDCFLQSKYAIDVSDGEIFNISFDFYKQSGTNATVGFQALDINNKTIQWLDSIRVNNNNGGNWWHKDGQITIPIGKGIVKVIPYVSLFKGQSSDYVYIDNITITRQTKKEQSIETQINQTKDKISLIADIKENENDLNPDAAINVYIDKSQSEGHRGTVSIGANNKFLINANTKIGKDFVLDAGKIESKSDFYLDLEQKWNSLPPLDKDNLRSISDYLTSFNLTTGYQNWSSTLSNNINYIDQSNIYSLPINRTFSTNGDLLFKQDTLEVMGAHTTIYESPYQNIGFIGMDNFKFNQKTVDTENTTKELSIKLLSNKARLNFTNGQPFERVWETGGAYIGIDGRDNPKINDNPHVIALSTNKYKAYPSNVIANYNEEDKMITFKPIPNADQELLLNDYNQINASLSKVSGQWTQQVVIETDGDLKGAIFTWFDGGAHHPIVATIYQLNNNRYMLESTYETSSDKTYRMCDFKKIEIEGGTYLSFVSLQYFENNVYRSALAIPTIYIDRLQSLNDEGNSHIGIDDDVLFRENTFNNGFYMGRKDTNYTEIGSAKDRNHTLAFLTTPGLTIGSSKNIYHNLVPVGTGNIIAFSNDNNGLQNWDNNKDVGSAYVLCKAATEISNKNLKVETKNTDVIEKATNDILKINAREYHFKNDIKLIQQWESEGEPEGKFATIDTQSDIGLFAEDLMEYSSLQSLLNITEDEFGNQSIVGVNYSRLSVILLEVLKKQEKRITNLEEELVKLKIQK